MGKKYQFFGKDKAVSILIAVSVLGNSGMVVQAEADGMEQKKEIYAVADAVISNVPKEIDHNPVDYSGRAYLKEFDGLEQQRTTLVKFDLSEIKEEDLSKAALKIYPISYDGGFAGIDIDVSIFNEEWDEKSVQWNSRPDGGRELIATRSIDSAVTGEYVSIGLGDALETYMEENPGASDVSFTLEVADSTADKNHCGIYIATKDCAGQFASYADYPITLVTGEEAVIDIEEIKMPEIKSEQNTIPALPGEVTVILNDGSQQQMPVIWDQMEAEQFSQKGMVFVNGTVEGTDIPAKARVNVVSTLNNNELTVGTSNLIPVVDGDFSVLYHPNKETVGSYVNDHSVIQNRKTGEWHTIGISHLGSDYSGNEVSFAHGVSDSLTERMKEVPVTEGGDDGIVLGDPELKPGRVAWAPHIIYVEEEELYYMFYRSDPNGEGADHTQDLKTELACATSPDLFHWTNFPLKENYLDKAGNKTTICYRDCNIQYFEGRWIMYYTGYHEHKNMGDNRNLPSVRMFVSDDLQTWTDAGSALEIMPGATMTGWSTAESPFVFEKDGTYYLSVTVTDSGEETYHDSFIFKSNDPMNFGSWNGNPNDIENNPTYVARISAHAPEYIEDNGQMYVTTCGWPGKTRYSASNGGVGIGKIKWVNKEDIVNEDNTESAVVNHSFETGDLSGWTAEGTAFGAEAVRNDSVFTRGSYRHRDQAGNYYMSSYPKAGDGGTGTLTSHTFVIGGDGHINLMVAGGKDINKEYVALVDADTKEIIFKETGRNSNNFFEVEWDASAYIGKSCYIQAVDRSTSGWGNICVDSVVVPQDPDNIFVIEKVIYQYDEENHTANVLGVESEPTEKLIIPESVKNPDTGVSYAVTGVKDGAFADNTKLEGILFEGKDIVFGKNIFSGCFGLKTVYVYPELEEEANIALQDSGLDIAAKVMTIPEISKMTAETDEKEVTLKWSGSTEAEYTIERKIKGQESYEVLDTIVNALEYTDCSEQWDMIYEYRVTPKVQLESPFEDRVLEGKAGQIEVKIGEEPKEPEKPDGEGEKPEKPDGEGEKPDMAEKPDGENEKSENPKTGDHTILIVWETLMIVSIIYMGNYRYLMKKRKNDKK